MKIALLSSVIMALAAGPAFARMHTTFECQDLNPLPDHAYSVRVQEYFCTPTPGFACPAISILPQATLFESTFAGLRKVGQWNVTKSQSPAVGSSVIFSGTDFDGHSFELEMVVDAAPLSNGGTFSRLTADTAQGRVTADLACWIAKSY